MIKLKTEVGKILKRSRKKGTTTVIVPAPIKVAKIAPTNPPLEARASRTLDAWKVTTAKVDASARLFTIPANWLGWGKAEDGQWKNAEGCFVRVQPPPDVLPQRLADLKRALYVAGAAAVSVQRARRAAVVTQEREPERPSATAREVVLEMVAEANTKDRAALTERVEKTLGKVGL
jgi:hypothetical protein